MDDDDKCSGCGETLGPDAWTGLLPYPDAASPTPKRRWHLKCLQNAYHSKIRRLSVPELRDESVFDEMVARDINAIVSKDDGR